MPQLSDAAIQKKLDQIVTLSKELDAEATRRYGPEARVYVDDTGNVGISVGTPECPNRQDLRHEARRSSALIAMSW